MIARAGVVGLLVLTTGGCVDRAIVWGEGASGGGGQDSGAGDDAPTSDDGEDAEEVDGGPDGDPDEPDDPCLDDPAGDCDGDGIPNDDDPFPTGGDPPIVDDSVLYANTPDALYTIDPETFTPTLIGPFVFAGSGEQVTDIAIDRFGVLYAVGTGKLYVCDPVTVSCTYLAEAPGANAAAFVPSAEPGGDDTLYLASAAGEWWRVDLVADEATVELVGSYGIGGSSGDIAASDPLTVASIDTPGGTAVYAIEPSTGTPVGELDFPDARDAWGLAFFHNILFAFTPDGQITLSNGIVRQTGLAWWGAATFPGSAG